jgi:hypothetical protein
MSGFGGELPQNFWLTTSRALRLWKPIQAFGNSEDALEKCLIFSREKIRRTGSSAAIP